ncbi:hypothetical protein HWV62_32936 [Athelia sp. TMB]|nr:hypothetical protein HWV62_32936 [Athelia sp. TMB]
MSAKSSNTEVGNANYDPDAERLAKLGHKQELNRGFSLFSLIGLAFAILNSWVAMSASMSLALPSGGPTAAIWGILLSGIGSLAMAASLAEICSAYPVASGQYYWTAVLAPPGWGRSLSYICGWINVAAWVALVATGGSLAGQLITGIFAILHDDYVLQRWHIFLVYLIYVIGAFLLNAFAVKLLPVIDKAALMWSLAGFGIISITLLATASPSYQSADFVFRGFENQTGWSSNGVAWILGLLQSAFGLTGFDAVAHMVEEIPNPAKNAPIAMVSAVVIGTFTSFIFIIICMFTLTDIDTVIVSPFGALLTIFYQATGSKTGAVCLLMFPVVSMAFATQGILTTSSRMTFAFARDKGLPFPKYFSRVNPTLQVPMQSLALSTVFVIIFGLVYLGSSSALNAILGSSVILLNCSYIMPIALLLFRGRDRLPDRPFKLGRVGALVNAFALIFAVFTTVFFFFPPDMPVTGNNFNYAIVVVGVVILLATITWFTNARKNYISPEITEAARESETSSIQTEKDKPKGETYVVESEVN